MRPPELILKDLPRLRERWFGGKVGYDDKEYDLLIISRLTERTLGWMHHSERLVKGPHACTLFVHPDDARARGLRTGDFATVTSAVGNINVPVEVTDDVMPGVICLPHAWGHTRSRTRQRTANAYPGASLNDITDHNVMDELTGNAVCPWRSGETRKIAIKGRRMKKRYLIPAILIIAVGGWFLWTTTPKNDVPASIGEAVAARPLPPAQTPQHPLLAEGQRSGMHAGSYNTDVSDYAGPLGENTTTKHRAFGKLMGVAPNISFDSEGRLITVALNLNRVVLYLLDPETLEILAQSRNAEKGEPR